MKQDPLVSIILPIHNRGYMLEMVLDSLFKQSYQNFEIILVDDSSTDNTAAVAKKFPRVKYYFRDNKGIKSSSATRNYAIERASGDILHFTDSDVICPPELIETHVKYHNQEEKLIVQSQLIRIVDLKQAYKVPYSKLYYSAAYFDTAAVSVRRKWVEQAGKFDAEHLPHGYEDLELGLRIRDLGVKVKRLVEEAPVWHYEGDFSYNCIQTYFKKRINEGEQGVSFYRKRPSREVKMMVMATPFFYFLRRILFNEKRLKSQRFYRSVRRLIDAGRIPQALARVRFNGYYFYLKGLEERVKREGGLKG